MRIGFIGLGKMGSAMARNLLRAGHQVAVYNRSREKAEALAGEGARAADSPADACRESQAVMTMLADDGAVEQVVFGENGVVSALAKGAVHISSSTIGTALARRLAAEHARRGQGYLSAPVFGRPEVAESRKLIVVAAGPSELVELCRPLFDAIGRQTFVAGSEPWQANAVKLCGNFMLASMIEAFGEAFATLRKAGVETSRFPGNRQQPICVAGLRKLRTHHRRRAVLPGGIRLEAGVEGHAPGARNGRGVRRAHAAGQPHSRSFPFRHGAWASRAGLVQRGAGAGARRGTVSATETSVPMSRDAAGKSACATHCFSRAST